MKESEDNMSAEEVRTESSLSTAKIKPKKRSLVERELETNLSARVTSPITNGDGSNTSRYGRTRRLKTDSEFIDIEKNVTKNVKPSTFEKTPTKVQSPVYKMHASNTPIKLESPKSTPKRIISLDSNLEDQIENIYNENMALSRFGSEEKKSLSLINKMAKVYVRKDLIQKREKEETVTLIKHMFSPVKSACKPNSHLSNILERSSEKYGLNSNPKSQYGYSSVVKTLDFDGNKKKKKENRDFKIVLSKSDLFDLEAKCEYQVGDLAWARMGTYPFWPCIITRDPLSGMFVKKKLFGRIEHDVLHVTFFGDNGRRSWIVDSMLRKFYGQLEFEATREQFSPTAKKKDTRFYSAFFISEKKLPQWNKSVEEAEMLLREPKRLRIDILNDMLVKERALKCTPKNHRSSKITRKDSDVSLSESLYDTLFSEDDGKTDDSDRSRNKSRNKSLDVSEVVTACLDNMAAKTGIIKIQRQSHMDRWLQKAKSKTPEKSQGKILSQKEKDSKITIQNYIKNNAISNINKKKPLPKTVMVQKPYSFRKSDKQITNVFPDNEHNYSTKLSQENNNEFSIDPTLEHKEDDGNFIKDSQELNTKAESVCEETKDTDNCMIVKMSEKHDRTSIQISDENTETDNINEISNIFNNSKVANDEINVHKDDKNVDISNLDSCESNISISDITKEKIPNSQENSKVFSQLESESQESFNQSEEYNQPSLYYVEDEENVHASSIGCNGQEKYSESLISNLEQNSLGNISNLQADRQSDISNYNNSSFNKVIKENEIQHQNTMAVIEKETANTDNLCEGIINNQNENEMDNKYINEINYSDINSSNELSHNGESSKTPIDIEISSKIIQINSIQCNLDPCLPQSSQNGYTEIASNQENVVEMDSQFEQETYFQSHCMEDDDARNSVITETQKHPIEPVDIKETDKELDELNSNTFNLNDVDVSMESVANDNNLKIRSKELELQPDMDMFQDDLVCIVEANKNENFVEGDTSQSCNLNRTTKSNEIESCDSNFNLKSTENVEDEIFSTMNKNNNNKQDEDIINNPEIGDVSSTHDIFNNIHNVNFKDELVECDYDSNVNYKDQLCSNNDILNTIDASSIIEPTTVKDNDIFTTNEELLNLPEELISESIKVNGFHESLLTENLEAETSSIHSEDSQPLSIMRHKLIKTNEISNKMENPEFVQYLETRLDDLIDQHPDQSRDDIVEYLYKTWEYEQNSKSDVRKTDEMKQSNMVKGLEFQDVNKKKNVSVRDRKHEKKSKNKNRLSLKRWLCPKDSESNEHSIDKDKNLETTDNVDENFEPHPIKSPNMDILKEISDVESIEHSSRLEVSVADLNNDIKLEEKINDDNAIETASICSIDSIGPKELPSKLNEEDMARDNDKINETVKHEFDPEIMSINSEDSDVSVTKRKQHLKGGEKTGTDDPEFVQYLELRQDALIDENPQLTQDEIVSYLYKTWLYEESVKSDIKKNDEVNQSNLVKGLKNEVAPKRIKKKVKAEKDFIMYDEIIKDKPKRKTSQPYYNEDLTDFEDEIEGFEIKTNLKLELSRAQVGVEINEKDVIELEEDEFDEVESYFEELTKPKPNLFKGLVREKVCDTCEKPGNLVKCKGCHAMFHVDCVIKKEKEVVEVPTSLRGRKKRKKTGRKPKNLEDSGSHSDEKSQDLSDEHNMSFEDTELESRIVDANNFEELLAEKMKEMINSNNLEYDSCSSDDVIDWNNCVAGKCEIVDVKFKPKKDNSDFKCKNCQKYDTPICFVCKMAVSKSGVEYRQKCHVAHCYKHYHIECLDHWPQTQFSSGEIVKSKKNEQLESMMCPRHVCHTCVSDDPRGCKTRFSGDKLARCIKCPATYHSFTKCLPAGSQILTGSHIICPRHYEHRPGKIPCHVNTGWCFICALGGTLICCEYCPTSFHAECLNIKPPEGGYMCEDCETGRLPLYGEMVWVKLGHYRWWPGLILHPCEIPDNIMAVKHTPGEFVVRFFGQYDHYWVNRGRVFPFQEGDSGKISSQKSKIDAAFTMAMEHAQRACSILKVAQPNEEESLDIASSLLPPHYVKLKVNKPCGSLCGRRIDIEESSLTQCDCNPDEDDPCGPYSQCLNRMLLTECGPICRAGDRCNNRAFEKRLYPKLVPYHTHHRGWGLKTLEEIKAGQFVIEYVGELIDEEEFRRRMNRKHEIRDENFYFLTLDKERMIDAGPKGNLARFMNHCCEPNCETQKWTVLGDVRVGLFAINDIPANSEVTFNYNLECAGIDKKRCLCGAKRCSGYIGAKPKQDDAQQKKSKVAAKRTYKKRKPIESPSTKIKPKRPVGRPAKPRELTDIEKDLLIIRNATNGLSSDSDSRLSSLEGDRKALKRKRVSFSTEELVYNGKSSPSAKKNKLEHEKNSDLD